MVKYGTCLNENIAQEQVPYIFRTYIPQKNDLTGTTPEQYL